MLFFSLFLFPRYQSQLSQAAGQQVAPLDTRFAYSAQEVTSLFEVLGEDGRQTYRTVVGIIDMIFPLVYGGLFTLVIAWLLRKLTAPSSPWMFVSLLPLTGVIFDYLENFTILRLLNQYPDISPDTVSWGEQMTQLKHVTGLLSVVIALVLVVILTSRYVAKRTTKPRPR
jgi:hypothetical protein